VAAWIPGAASQGSWTSLRQQQGCDLICGEMCLSAADGGAWGAVGVCVVTKNKVMRFLAILHPVLLLEPSSLATVFSVFMRHTRSHHAPKVQLPASNPFPH
jgi:hypothetical protein